MIIIIITNVRNDKTTGRLLTWSNASSSRGVRPTRSSHAPHADHRDGGHDHDDDGVDNKIVIREWFDMDIFSSNLTCFPSPCSIGPAD